MKQLAQFACLFLMVFTYACSKDNVTTTGGVTGGNTGDQEWLVPSNEVRDGGPGKDGIPSVDSPNFSSIGQIDFLDPEDVDRLLRLRLFQQQSHRPKALQKT